MSNNSFLDSTPLYAGPLKTLQDQMEEGERRMLGLLAQTPKLRATPPPLPPRTAVFCEGTRTEPLYFQELADRINRRFAPFCGQERILVFGAGRNTMSLLEFARQAVRRLCPETRRVWLVYDRDDFPRDYFDNAQASAETRRDAEGRRYRTAWSNPCMELWFLLHFQLLETDVPREQYRRMLRRYFPYEKQQPGLFSLLEERTPEAIRNAKRLIRSYETGTPPSRMAPATRVYELVEELLEYL